MIVVSDTTPLNYLVLVSKQDILPLLFGRVIVPEAVMRELQAATAPPEVRQWLSSRPAWLETKQAATPPDTDGDGTWDGCETTDLDNDGYKDRVEALAGTNLLSKCGVNAWPADINNDGFSDGTDITMLAGWFGKAVPTVPARGDIADPPDGFVDGTDITSIAGHFGKPCGP